MGMPVRGRGFAISGALHALALGWVALGPAVRLPPPAISLYDSEIRPNEKRLVWYDFHGRLPEVAPDAARKPARPARARVKLEQTLVAGSRDNARPPQIIWMPAPEIEPSKPVPLPNVLDVTAGARPVREFAAPPAAHLPAVQAVLPEAPRTSAPAAGMLPLAIPLPKPQPRAFVPPAETRRQPAAPLLAPEAPDIANPSAAPAEASLAIVGLDPAKTVDFPAPPGSRQAGFSAGPAPQPSGDNAGAPKAMIVVPGLLARGGDADSRPALVAAIPPTTREQLAASAPIVPPAADPPSETRATRVASAPDPLLEGRTVYTMAIQMPNVTSYIGSWMVWFAERDPAAGPGPDIQPPLPLHKVDPKYIAAAAAERVEGKVRLAAVIRKDGRVDDVRLLRHVDDRLDRSAEEALAKWEFEPAFRAGRAVDVDAVFEIPFTLAPRPSR